MICIQSLILHANHVVLALGRCILRPFRGSVYIYLGLGIYGGGACLHSLQFKIHCYKNLYFEVALVGALRGSWDAGLGLEILPKTIPFTPARSVSPNHRECFWLRSWALNIYFFVLAARCPGMFRVTPTLTETL